MKKLMITMVALASGLAAWTANAAGDGSQGSSWVASEKTAEDWNADALWTGDVLTNKEGAVVFDADAKVLKLSTGTDVLQRSITAAGSYPVTDQYFFDVRADLLGQALDTLPTLGDNDKFALFLVDMSELGDGMPDALKGTNLCALAKAPDGQSDILLVYRQDQTKTLVSGNHRLTIRAFANVMKETPVRPGFMLYIDGENGGVDDSEHIRIDYYVPFANGAPDYKNYKAAQDYLSGKILSTYSSLRDYIALSRVSGDDAKNMAGVAFAGNANISEVTMQVDPPIVVASLDESVVVELDGVTVSVGPADAYSSDGKVSKDCTFTVTATDENKPVIKVAVGGEVVATLANGGTYAYTYEKGAEVTFTAYAIGATATIDGGDAINYASLADLLASDAFANAAESAEIELNADATIDCLAAEGKAVTLDLNGKTITGKGSENYAAVIYSTGAGLTIKDSSADKTGKVVVAEDAVEGCAAVAIVENEFDVSIEAGIFDGAVTVDEYSTAVTITGGSFLASANTATAEQTTGTTTDGGDAAEGETEGETDTPTDTTETTAEPTFALADYVVEGKKAELNEAKDYWVIVDKPVTTVVAKIGDTEYDTLQAAVGAAVAATSETTIEICADITLTNTLTITGSGIEATKITINNPEGKTVTFGGGESDMGVAIDGATVTLTGAGTWSRTTGTKTFFCVGEAADTVGGNLIVSNGIYSVNQSSHVMNVAKGTITIDGGSFTTQKAGKDCVRAEETGALVVNGGVFTIPDGNTSLPICKEGNGTITLTSESTAQFTCSAEAAKTVSGYITTEGYKLRKVDENTYYTVAKITYATLTTTFDQTMVESVTITNAAGEVITDTQFDVDDAVVLYANPTLKDGYELDEESSVLSVTMTGNAEIKVAAKATAPAVEPVEPGSETKCADETSATTEAAAINNAKTTMIKVPEIEGIDKDTFCNLFTATVVTSGEGEAKTYSVKVDLDPTADGVKAIQAVIDEIAKPDADGAVKLDLTKLATETQKATITAQPGLYYTVYAGAESPAKLDAVKSTQATTATLELEFPTEGTRGFYKIGVSAKEVPVTTAQ